MIRAAPSASCCTGFSRFLTDANCARSRRLCSDIAPQNLNMIQNCVARGSVKLSNGMCGSSDVNSICIMLS